MIKRETNVKLSTAIWAYILPYEEVTCCLISKIKIFFFILLVEISI